MEVSRDSCVDERNVMVNYVYILSFLEDHLIKRNFQVKLVSTMEAYKIGVATKTLYNR